MSTDARQQLCNAFNANARAHVQGVSSRALAPAVTNVAPLQAVACASNFNSGGKCRYNLVGASHVVLFDIMEPC